MLELTSTEVKHLDKNTKLYEGVGKMYVSPVYIGIKVRDRSDQCCRVFRFVFSPTPDVEKKLSSSISELKSDVESLNKKLHYLETTHKNSREHIEKIIGSGMRA